MQKLAFMRELFDEVWENGNFAFAEKRINEEFKMEAMGEDVVFPRKDFRDLVAAFRSLTGPPRIGFLHHMESGDWITLRFRLTSGGPDGATPINVLGMMMTRIAGNRITENYTQFEYVQLFEQLGLLPRDALAALMSRTRLVWEAD
ncbi:ester cyclase [Phycobacter azelaicus]|uniref:ester cyclase n=1 Tax=Phycobacter azelaicus TaxID=2668075 RepID=UPI0018675F26|nr:ester cyclase [Phycobacter azelaicus]MBE1296030.1 hypothetical protein [Paracoccaceae bacterium]